MRPDPQPGLNPESPGRGPHPAQEGSFVDTLTSKRIVDSEAAMKRILMLAAVIAVVAAVGVGAFVAYNAVSDDEKSPEAQAGDLLSLGLQQHVDGKLAEAAVTYREVLKKDAQNKFAYYNLGVIDQTEQRLDAAENNYRLAIGIDPAYTPALFNLAIVRAALGYPLDAIVLYRKVIEVDPNSANSHLNAGLLLVANGVTDEGNAELATAVASIRRWRRASRRPRDASGGRDADGNRHRRSRRDANPVVQDVPDPPGAEGPPAAERLRTPRTPSRAPSAFGALRGSPTRMA